MALVGIQGQFSIANESLRRGPSGAEIRYWMSDVEEDASPSLVRRWWGSRVECAPSMLLKSD